MSDYSALQAEVEDSEALRVNTRLQYLYDVFGIFMRNHARLSDLLSAIADLERMLPVFDTDRRNDRRVVLAEVLTDLHNYLASFKTFIEHSRLVMRKHYKGQSILNEYQARIDAQFAHDPLSCFVDDMRDYMLHYSLPSTFLHLSFHRSPETGDPMITSGTTISRDPLLKWKRWSPEARSFITAAPNDIDLLQLVNTHYTLVQQFHEWLIGSLKAIHASELKWLSDMTSRLANWHPSQGAGHDDV